MREAYKMHSNQKVNITCPPPPLIELDMGHSIELNDRQFGAD